MAKSYLTLKEKYDRIIVLIDMDAFYTQVEENLDPALKGKPIAVSQYLENSGLIAVNYAARALGITRHMRESDVRAANKDVVIIKVASKNGKADISKYRDAGVRVAKVFQKFTNLIERASIDEAYLDITEKVAERMEEMKQKKFEMEAPHFINTYAVGYDNIGSFIQNVSAAVDETHYDIDAEDRATFGSSKLRLLVGSTIVSDIRAEVMKDTGYTCSAGIGHNKILAKLVCGMNKPNKQTIISLDSIHGLFSTLEIGKIKSMGGKTGEQVCKTLNAKVMNDLLKFSEDDLTRHFGPRVGKFLYWIARGIDLERVTLKMNSKSIAVSKNFRGKSEITLTNTLKYWLQQLSKEVKERLENDAIETNRISRQLIVQFTQNINGKNQSFSRTVPLNSILNHYTSDEIATEAYNIIQRNSGKFLKEEGKCNLNNAIRHLGISAGKFEDVNGGAGMSGNIQSFFNNQQKKLPQEKEEEEEEEDEGSELDDELDEQLNEEEVLEMIKIQDNEGSKIRVKSDSELMEKAKNDTSAACSSKNIKEESSESDEDEKYFEKDFKVCASFNGECVIRGLATLKHWLANLFRDLDSKLKKEFIKNFHAPQEIEFSWTQIINGEKNDFSETIEVSFFSPENVISIEFLIDIMKDMALSFFIDEGVKINPVCFMQLNPMKFKVGDEWCLKLYEDSSKKVESSSDLIDKVESSSQIEEKATPAWVDEISIEEAKELDLLEQEVLNHTYEDEPMAENIQFEPEPSVSTYLEPSTTDYAEPSTADYPQPSTSAYVPPLANKTQESFERISLDDLNPLEECLMCGKMIRKYDMLTHVDGHVAMKLAQSQREEYREEQKLKSIGKWKPKPKKVIVKNGTITKYVVKRDENSENFENKIMCEECNEIIEESDYQTHKDHHFAQKLRREQMTLKSSENNKRKLPPTAAAVNNSAKKTKSVKEFFTK